MRILAVGGGSGGHVTPIVAVLNELKQRTENADIRVWCDKAFYARTQEAIAGLDADIRVQKVISGKFRRFYDFPLWRHLVRLRTIVIPNIIDSFKVIIGVGQSMVRMIIWRPDVVFCKGGFVSLPVGMAARMLRIPVVLHDSDSHPGLANRLLARWATTIGTGASLEHYSYPKTKAHYVGIPIKQVFHPYDETERLGMKKELGFMEGTPLIVITGGGLGAKPINDAVVAVLDELLMEASVLLISGDTQFAELRDRLGAYNDSSRFQLHAFLGDTMPGALAAADIVVARAGATTLLELAAIGAPTILVPNPNLPGGHQVKNARPYEERGAALVLDEPLLVSTPSVLEEAVRKLLQDAPRRKDMSVAIKQFAKPDAAADMAEIIVNAANNSKSKGRKA